MDHYHTELIEDPQWVSHCVKNECSFRDHIQGYVCRTHCSKHVCSGSTCSLIRAMVTKSRYSSEPQQCPVVDLLVFHKPDVEFRGAYYTPGDTEPGYGAMDTRKILGYSDEDLFHLTLKSRLPVMIALFSTALTQEFTRQYDRINRTRIANTGVTCSAWMSTILQLAETAVLKTAMGVSSLFSSQDDKIKRFVKKMTFRYNDKHAKRVEFYIMVVMLTLCLFPYLKHRVLGDQFNNRTLVHMCFDKTHTSHSQWSTLSSHIHLHVKQPEFIRRVCASKPSLGNSLAVVVTVMLDEYMMKSQYSDKEMSQAQTLEHRGHATHLTLGGKDTADPAVRRKRKTACSSGFYELHKGRLEAKVMHCQTKES